MNFIQSELDTARVCGRSLMAVLVDPDKHAPEQIGQLIDNIRTSGVDMVFVGGSLMVSDRFETCISSLKQHMDTPVVIFPGHPMQISASADALILLSLISGRNPELLIGHHVYAAPALKKSGLELLPTGYILIDGGRPTTVSYISNTQPIPRDKPEIAVSTAMAGEMLGLRNIYLEAGSGADDHVPLELIRAVRSSVQIPIITGGGIKKPETANAIVKAGADVVVVGTALEKDAALMREMAEAVREA